MSSCDHPVAPILELLDHQCEDTPVLAARRQKMSGWKLNPICNKIFKIWIISTCQEGIRNLGKTNHPWIQGISNRFRIHQVIGPRHQGRGKSQMCHLEPPGVSWRFKWMKPMKKSHAWWCPNISKLRLEIGLCAVPPAFLQMTTGSRLQRQNQPSYLPNTRTSALANVYHSYVYQRISTCIHI